MKQRELDHLLKELASKEDKIRMQALDQVMELTDQKVDWVYDVWETLTGMLEYENSFHRSIAIKVLCNLAKSDDQDRLGGMLDTLLFHTKDKKFITPDSVCRISGRWL
ncbi:hypothetical protein ACFLXB_09525 [Chloroflexota bacterium]